MGRHGRGAAPGLCAPRRGTDDDALERAVVDRIAFFLSLDDDLRPFYALARDDPPFAPILERLYGYHQVKFLTPFENACWAVLSTRTPMPAARKLKDALTERFGGSLIVDGTLHLAYPEPARLAAVDPADLAATLGDGRKARYLSGIARAFAGTDEGWLRSAPYDEVEAWLRRLDGIGPWSSAFVLLRGLGRMERVPAEKRLLEAVAGVYGQGRTMTSRDVERIAARYGPWQGYWAHYLRAAS